MVPITYILFGYFGENNSGNVTGMLLGFFGIFGVGYIVTTTLIVNPHNMEANIPYIEGNNSTYLFDYEVAKHVPRAL